MGIKKKTTPDIENLDMYELEDEGFVEGNIPSGKAIASFSFGMNINEQNNTISKELQPIRNKSDIGIPAAQVYRTTPRGLTPAVDGELYTIKRCYQFRQSTVRKLNELKANHQDINVYLNTIIDDAISHYYDYVFNSNGN